MRKITFLFIFLLSIKSLCLQAQVCATPGKDGNGIGITGVINTYYPGVGSAIAGNNILSVGIPTGATSNLISTGDLLLVIQIQGSAINPSNSINYGNGVSGTGFTSIGLAGYFEFVVANSAVVGGNINISGAGAGNGLVNSYISSVATSSQGQRTFQVIRVPQYSTAQLASGITSDYWNGSTGGILAMDVAGSLDFKGITINLDGKGFRGGGALILNGGAGGSNTDFVTLSSDNYNGSKGEGIAGTPKYVYSPQSGAVVTNALEGYPNGSFGRGAPGNAGGGGTDGDPTNNDENSGGGGGSNGGMGGQGGFSQSSGLSVGGLGGDTLRFSNRIFLGGGGGAGSRKDASGSSGSGGAGGGIVLIQAGSITSSSGTATISVNGLQGINSTNAGGGGGAGGSIILTSLSGSNSNVALSANGGNGSNAVGASPNEGVSYGPGGGGGGGFILGSDAPFSSQIVGGQNGTTTAALDPFGATSGSIGSSSFGTSTLSGVSSGASCAAEVSVTLTVDKINPLIGTKVIFTVTAKNNGFSTATSAKVIDRIPTGYSYVSDDGAGAYVPGSGTWSLGNVLNGSSSILNITATVLSSGKRNDTATISSNNFDIITSNNVAIVSTSPNSLPFPKADSTITNAGKVATINNITVNDVGGVYASVSSPIATNSVDLDTLVAGIQTTFTPASGEGVFSVLSTGKLTFTPTAGFSGIALAYYTVADQFNRSTKTAQIKIRVLPLVVRDTITTLSGSPITESVWNNDLGKTNPLSVQVTTAPKNGTAVVDPLTGDIKYTSNVSFAGKDSLYYSLCDVTSPTPQCSTPGVFAITVKSPVLPIPVEDTTQGFAGSSTIFSNITTNDIAGSYPISTANIDLNTTMMGIQNSITLASQGTFSVNALGKVTFNPVAGFSGTSQTSYTIVDNLGNRSVKSGIIYVKIYPVGVRDTISTSKNTPVLKAVLTNDLGNLKPSTFAIKDGPFNGTAVPIINASGNPTGSINYAPNTGFLGLDSVGYIVCDKTTPTALCTNIAYLVIKVKNPTNLLPVPVADYGTTSSGQVFTFPKITNNDITGSYRIDSTSVDLDTLASGKQTTYKVNNAGTFSVDNVGNVKFTPIAGFSGIAATYYTVSDIKGKSSTSNAIIQIKVNPLARPDKDSTIQDVPITINVLNNDLGKIDPTTVKLNIFPANGSVSIDAKTGIVTYTPFPGFVGNDFFTYRICDKTLPSALCSGFARVDILIKPKNVKPNYADIGVVLNGISPTSVGDTLTFTVIVSNKGADLAQNISLKDSLPASLTFIPTTLSSNSGHFNFNSTTSTISWVIDSLPDGQSGILTYKVISIQEGTVINTATVSSLSQDTILVNNTSSLSISVLNNQFFVPKAFTPNGDGKNDIFKIGNLSNFPDNSIQIFNRWGNLVYKTNSYGKNDTNWWDGSGLSDGTYYYILQIKVSGKTRTISGYTTILRNLSH